MTDTNGGSRRLWWKTLIKTRTWRHHPGDPRGQGSIESGREHRDPDIRRARCMPG